jgi:transcriptional regulator with XRE-family HTH domain
MITPEQVKAARKALGWSQERVSAESRVSESVVARFERGLRTSDDAIDAIHGALKAGGAIFDGQDGGATAALEGREK